MVRCLTTRGAFLAAWGNGVHKALFSGEGVFMTRLTGPGPVLLQTLKRRQELTVEGR